MGQAIRVFPARSPRLRLPFRKHVFRAYGLPAWHHAAAEPQNLFSPVSEHPLWIAVSRPLGLPVALFSAHLLFFSNQSLF